MITLQVFSLLRHAFGNKIINAASDISRRVLFPTCDHQILLIDDATIVQRQLMVNDFHQGRFTGPVTPYQTDTLIFFDMQFSIIEQRRVAE